MKIWRFFIDFLCFLGGLIFFYFPVFFLLAIVLVSSLICKK